MADESLLELERVLRSAPDDAQTRHRLVSLLARSGRRREALEHAGPLHDSRDLTNEIWAEELERMEKTVAVPGAHEVTDVALDPDGEMLAWSSNREGFHVAAIRTGKVLHSASGARRDRLIAVPGKVFCKDEVRGPITCVEWSPQYADARVTRRTGGGNLLDVSPGGDLILGEGNQQHGVYTWPAFGAVIEHPSRLNPPVVDWDTRRLLVNGLRGLEVSPFLGPAPAPIEGRSTVQPVVLGSGLVARYRPGLVVHSLINGWTTTLYELKGEVAPPYARPSLSGRFVRLVLGGAPVRFSIDLQSGALLEKPERVERLALSQTADDRPGEVLWHPHADLVLQRRRGGTFELRTLAGMTIFRLPQASAPQAWTKDGRALLVLRAAGEGRAWLELWRCP